LVALEAGALEEVVVDALVWVVEEVRCVVEGGVRYAAARREYQNSKLVEEET
jgi:hypothetical protein